MLSRRKFVSSTLATGVALVSQKSTAQPAKRTIVDAQVHLWKAESDDWKWVPGIKPQLPEPFNIERLVPIMDEASVERVVIVPPSWPGDRNDYALEAAQRYPGRFAVMGRIPIQNPQSAALLPKWKEQRGMLGIRVTFNTEVTIPWLTDGTADWLWPAAEKAGVPVMFLTLGQMSKFARIAERHPQLTLIIDHMGLNSSTRTLRFTDVPAAIDQTIALAKYPNVSVKLSGALGNSVEPYPFRDMALYLQRVFDAYGPQRCYWASDMTNSLAKASYRQRVTHFTEELNFLSESDKDWVMGRAILARLKWGLMALSRLCSSLGSICMFIVCRLGRARRRDQETLRSRRGPESPSRRNGVVMTNPMKRSGMWDRYPMSLRSSGLHVLLALSLMGSPAAAQDIRGMEACGAEKQMDRRTGCLQANVEFLQQELVKLRRETQAQVAAAKAEAKAQNDALKAALTKLEAELEQVKAKAEPKVEKKQ